MALFSWWSSELCKLRPKHLKLFPALCTRRKYLQCRPNSYFTQLHIPILCIIRRIECWCIYNYIRVCVLHVITYIRSMYLLWNFVFQSWHLENRHILYTSKFTLNVCVSYRVKVHDSTRSSLKSKTSLSSKWRVSTLVDSVLTWYTIGWLIPIAILILCLKISNKRGITGNSGLKGKWDKRGGEL